LLAGQWPLGVVAWVLRACSPMGFWPGAVPPWMLRRLGLTRMRLPLVDNGCRGPRAAVYGAGIAGHDPGDGWRIAALSREVGTYCDRDKECRGCDDQERSGQSPRSQATVRPGHACGLASP
jgi:hypothetical protein